jgi:IS1 family transposase
MYCADRREVYAERVPPEVLIQTKIETHNIERDNGRRRRWLARFRRRTRVASHSLETIDVTAALFSKFHSPAGKHRLFNLKLVS